MESPALGATAVGVGVCATRNVNSSGCWAADLRTRAVQIQDSNDRTIIEGLMIISG